MILILVIIYLVNYWTLRHKKKSFLAQDNDLLNLLLSPITVWGNLWKLFSKQSVFKRMIERKNLPYVELSVQLFDCVEDSLVLQDEMKKWLITVGKIDSADIKIEVVSVVDGEIDE